MSTIQGEPTLEALVTRLAELEKELAALRVEQLTADEQAGVGRQRIQPERSRELKRETATGKGRSRRGMLRKSLLAAAALVGAGTLIKTNTGTALANGNEGPTTFTSTDGVTPAVTAIGSNGSTGVSATSDGFHAIIGIATGNKGTGVTGQGINGNGVSGFSQSSDGVHGESNSASGVSGQSGSASGVLGSSVFGTGVAGSGLKFGSIGVAASSLFGTALQVEGHIQVLGDAVGQATLPKGQTSVTVSTPAATTASNILLTPLDRLTGTLWVTRVAGSFTIHAQHPESSNVRIAFLIIN